MFAFQLANLKTTIQNTQDYLKHKRVTPDTNVSSEECDAINGAPLIFTMEKSDKIDFSIFSHDELSTNSNNVFSMRSYVCDVEGCNKTFTSSHGLKYHKAHGHIEFKTFERRPYICQVPGCSKSYKNNNGLKYHILHAHTEAKITKK